MSADEDHSKDEHIGALLRAYDNALASGRPSPEIDCQSLPPDLLPQLSAGAESFVTKFQEERKQAAEGQPCETAR